MAPDWLEELQVLGQGAVALILGGAVGWERHTAEKAAGMRTMMLVCLASMLFVRLGEMLMTEFTAEYSAGNIRADPVHIIAAIVTGISFLGAGTIFRDRETPATLGLTTAASLLATACIGIAIALDRYIIAVGVTLLSLFVLRTLLKLERREQPTIAPP